MAKFGILTSACLMFIGKGVGNPCIQKIVSVPIPVGIHTLVSVDTFACGMWCTQTGGQGKRSVSKEESR